ncbi:MAG: GTPase Era [Deltaproteobacteria bacterium]|nr:GTPase Era [Deltaproteobacteria bacterium]
MLPEGFRSGFAALAGRPNVGKSTLLNALVGEAVAICTHRPQTTRSRVRGIVNRPTSQIVFVDTPGIHDCDRAINRFMLDEARSVIGEVDLAVLLVEATGRGRQPDSEEEDRLALDIIGRAACPALLAVNKIDLLKNKAELLPILQAYDRTGLFDELLPVSAKEQEGLDDLLVAIESRLPKGPRLFPPDIYTDQSERQMVAELIRQQVFLLAAAEVPYSVAVEVEAFEEECDLVRILALLYVERKSQKGILIGKGGRMLKSIGSESRKSIERLLGCRIYLQLQVKVAARWSHSSAGLDRVGYRKR